MRHLCDFKPPKPNPAIVWLGKLILPVYLKVLNHLSLQVVLPPQVSLDFFRSKPVVVLLNHPDRQDALIAGGLAKLFEHPYCIVAREVFDWKHGFQGWFFQHIGCYSVDRGILDLASMHMTQKILAQLQRQLIVFPEAEITGDDDIVHPFNRALIHAILGAQKEIAKHDSSKSVWIIPGGTHYQLETDIETTVRKALRDVERKLDMKPDHSADARTRAEAAVGVVVSKLSDHYRFVLPDEQPQHEQVRLLAKHVCELISTYVNFEHAVDLSAEQLLHSLRSHVSKQVETAANGCSYQRKLSLSIVRIYDQFLSDLDRVERLLILQRVLTHPPTPMEVCRIVDFLESETCGRITAKGRQRATVCLGAPIEVLPYLESYKRCKSTAIEELRAVICREMQSALDGLHERMLVDLGRREEPHPAQGAMSRKPSTLTERSAAKSESL